MAAKDLIALAVAKRRIQVVSGTTHDTLIGELITAVSDAIEKYCRRSFYARTLDELYDGAEGDRLYLREYPIQSISWVRYDPQTVLEAKNTASTVEQARVAISSTNCILTSIANASTTTTNLALSTYTTLATLATQIAATSGWESQVKGSTTGDYGRWPSADLYVAPYLGDGLQSMGALNARNVWAQLRMHVQELADYAWHPGGYLYAAESLIWPYGLRDYQGRDGGDFWVRSPGYWRVKYVAGYTTIPEAVTEAAGEWVATLFHQTLRDPSSAQEAVAGGQSRAWAVTPPNYPPPRVRALLASYRRHDRRDC